MEVKIIRKAYIVYHDDMINRNPHLGFPSISDIPHVYAESPGKAKVMSCDAYEWEINGEEPKYTDLKVKRAKGADIVLFEGDEMKRWSIKNILKKRERMNKLLQLPEDEHFYVQDARDYVGNAVLWWGLNNVGYVTDLKKAHKYTKQDIINQFGDGRDTDKIWIGSHVEKAVREYVDAQGLSYDYSI